MPSADWLRLLRVFSRRVCSTSGVNIGGWLVLESWITPQLYADNGVKTGLGEWGFCQHVGKANCSSVLNQHWDTWVTFDHLKTLASVGVNWLRVPVGYWIVDVQPDEPFADPVNGEPIGISLSLLNTLLQFLF